MAYTTPGVRALGTVDGLVREMRPWQWYKQLVLLLGILFSKNAFNLDAWLTVITAIVAFCCVVGTTYIFNDISDLEADRRHPRKQHRPIASGQVSVPVASIFAGALFVVGLAVSYAINTLFLLVVLTYLVQNVVYSVSLKHVMLVDILVIATGFVLRAIAGVVAIGVYLSPWLVVCTFLFALLLAIGKRRHELVTSEDPEATRGTLSEYSEQGLDHLFLISIALLLMAYSLYTFYRAGTWMMLTLPFAFFGVFRYHHLVLTGHINGRPENLLTDRQTLINATIWLLLVFMVLYGNPDALVRMMG